MKKNTQPMKNKPTVGIFKFTGCAGCQLEFLHLEDMLLNLLDIVDINYWMMVKRENVEGPWDISLVEGGISTPEEMEEIKEIRKKSTILVAFGDCAVTGCVPSIRNWIPQMEAEQHVYPDPLSIHSTKVLGIGEYVKVDMVLPGCPPHRDTIIEVLKASLLKIRPRLRQHPVCVECKLKGNTCLIISKKLPCMGPVTAAGCGAICPTLNRVCEGCYGPMSNPNPSSLVEVFRTMGYSDENIKRKFRKYAGMATIFQREASE